MPFWVVTGGSTVLDEGTGHPRERGSFGGGMERLSNAVAESAAQTEHSGDAACFQIHLRFSYYARKCGICADILA